MEEHPAAQRNQDRKRQRSDSEDVRFASSIEDLAKGIIRILQEHGKLTLDQIVRHTKSDEKLVRSVLDVLLATPLVNQERRSGDAHRKDRSFLYRHGIPQSEAIDLGTLVTVLRATQQDVTACVERIKRMKQALEVKPPLNATAVVKLIDELNEEREDDPLVHFFREKTVAPRAAIAQTTAIEAATTEVAAACAKEAASAAAVSSDASSDDTGADAITPLHPS